jgi:hypothetical protein
MRSLALALVLPIAAAGCGSFDSHFWAAAPPRSQTLDVAVWCGARDVAVLEDVGGVRLGDFTLTTRHVPRSERLGRIATEAARVGATHVVLVDETSHVVAARPRGRLGQVDLGGAGRRYRDAVIDVYYVSPDRWSLLPTTLRPQ